MQLRQDHKATLYWEFKENGYKYNKIIFEVKGENLIATFKASRETKRLGGRDHTAVLKNFKNKTACEAIQSFPTNKDGTCSGGRHFEDGIKQVYYDLCLPVCLKRVLKDI